MFEIWYDIIPELDLEQISSSQSLRRKVSLKVFRDNLKNIYSKKVPKSAHWHYPNSDMIFFQMK